MKRSAAHLKVLFLFLSVISFSVSQSVWAQSQNLLVNPGFEPPFTSYSDATPARQVAQGWLPWYVGGGQSLSENVYPLYYPASNVTDGLGVPRIRSGNDAQQYLSFFASHDAGVYQRVTGITQGTQLRFSAYIYVWSSSFDDDGISEENGGVVVQVGIDPTGGTNGESANIVWSTPTVQYDAYNEYSITATASGTAVTVFVRTTVTNPVKNNNIYVDDAALVVATGTGQVPTATKTLAPTNTLAPTATKTLTPTTRPTNTPVAATNTPGDLGIFTATAQPTTITAPTQTPVTPTQVIVPTNTLAPSATPSFTPTLIPASVTPTQEQQPTLTPTTESPANAEFPGKVVHTVQAGDTVGELATLYGSTTDAIISANGLNGSALIRVGQALVVPVRLGVPVTSTPTVTPVVPVGVPTAVPGQPSTTVYVVQSGDTLNRIAARFNTSVTAIAQLNGIANVNIIRVGQQLLIPTGRTTVPPVTNPSQPPPVQQTTYVVQSGDTLFRIALRFRVPLLQLAQANGIVDTNRLYVGQVLVIP